MTDGSENCKRQLAFELQNSRVYEPGTRLHIVGKRRKNRRWRKKKSASDASREVVWGGERVALPPSQDTARLASIDVIFPI